MLLALQCHICKPFNHFPAYDLRFDIATTILYTAAYSFIFLRLTAYVLHYGDYKSSFKNQILQSGLLLMQKADWRQFGQNVKMNFKLNGMKEGNHYYRTQVPGRLRLGLSDCRGYGGCLRSDHEFRLSRQCD